MKQGVKQRHGHLPMSARRILPLFYGYFSGETPVVHGQDGRATF
jgi:hypothetical protein